MIVCLGLIALSSLAQESTALFVRADRILVQPGEETTGAVLIENGIIVAVGPGVAAPEGAREISGAVVCAGYLDAWSSLGVEPASVRDGKTSPATSVLDGLDLFSNDHLRLDSLESGVTALRIQSGVEAEVGGLSAVVRNDPGQDGPGAVLMEDACVAATIGVTRNGKTVDVFDRVDEVDDIADLVEAGLAYRESWLDYEEKLAEWEKEIAEKEEELEKDFKKAKKKRDEDIEEAEEKGKEHKEKKYKEDKKPKRPRTDTDKETMARVGSGEIPLVVEVHRYPEIRELLDRTESFDRLRLILAGATEAKPFADELAMRRIPVIVWPTPMGVTRPDEFRMHDLELAATLDDAGVQVLFGSGGHGAARDLPALAALAVGHGLDRTAAFEALTLGPARSFDVAQRIGSVERGKDADLLVLDGDPLDVATRARFVILRGEVVVER